MTSFQPHLFLSSKALGFILLLLLQTSCSSSAQEVEPEVKEGEENVEEPSAEVLRKKAGFGIGAAVNSKTIKNEPSYDEVLSSNFNQITAEYEMKMSATWESPNAFNWEGSDFLVEFAEANEMAVHGHTLVWYKAFPQWFVTAEYDSIAFENQVKNYITEVVSRYKGRIKSWDVVNEAFADGGGFREEGQIKNIFRDPIGFYGRCFQYARAADPDALLFYNDYNVVLDSGKRKAIREMLQRFNEEGFPIDGLGDQFHYMESTNKAQIKVGFEDMAATGLLIHFSELDIRMNISQSDAYVFTEKEKEKQALTYQAIVEMYERLPEKQKFAITTWGVSDKETWLLDWWHEKEYPLLFDSELKRKKAYEGFLEGLN